MEPPIGVIFKFVSHPLLCEVRADPGTLYAERLSWISPWRSIGSMLHRTSSRGCALHNAIGRATGRVRCAQDHGASSIGYSGVEHDEIGPTCCSSRTRSPRVSRISCASRAKSDGHAGSYEARVIVPFRTCGEPTLAALICSSPQGWGRPRLVFDITVRRFCAYAGGYEESGELCPPPAEHKHPETSPVPSMRGTTCYPIRGR
jgi:hypothetical protein